MRFLPADLYTSNQSRPICIRAKRCFGEYFVNSALSYDLKLLSCLFFLHQNQYNMNCFFSVSSPFHTHTLALNRMTTPHTYAVVTCHCPACDKAKRLLQKLCVLGRGRNYLPCHISVSLHYFFDISDATIAKFIMDTSCFPLENVSGIE